jgi:hypothetical protein
VFQASSAILTLATAVVAVNGGRSEAGPEEATDIVSLM